MSKRTELDAILLKILPTVSILNIPLSAVNVIILLNLGVLGSPSSCIYFNLVIMDLLNSITGLIISFDHELQHWFKVESNIYLFSFDATIFLIFGLAVVRLFCLKASALRILQNLRPISYVLVVVSWVVGGFAVIYPRIIKSPNFVDFAWFDLVECLLISTTLLMTLYTWVAIRANRSLRRSAVFRSASTTCLLLTVNFVCSYSYYLFLNGARLYLLLHDMDCPPDSWVEVLVCQDSLRIGVTCMCLQSLVNNAILLAQPQFRQLLRVSADMCAVDVRTKCCCRQTDNSPYI